MIVHTLWRALVSTALLRVIIDFFFFYFIALVEKKFFYFCDTGLCIRFCLFIATCTSLSSESTTTMTTQRVFFDNDIKSEDLTSNSEEPISQTEMMRFALEIAKGMEHLEAKGIVHRDLAARNVLMDENLVLKVIAKKKKIIFWLT